MTRLLACSAAPAAELGHLSSFSRGSRLCFSRPYLQQAGRERTHARGAAVAGHLLLGGLNGAALAENKALHPHLSFELCLLAALAHVSVSTQRLGVMIRRDM